MKRAFQSVLLLLTLAPFALAGEIATLRNGFTMRYDHREVLGENTRLYMDENSKTFVDIPTTEIARFEKEKDGDPGDIHNQQEPPPPVIVDVKPIIAETKQPVATETDLNTLVRDASFKVQLDPDLVHSLIRYESGGNPNAVSRKGARGLMQLMPQTAQKLGVQNSFDPLQNIEAGTRYLRSLMEQFNFNVVKALAAYNAGPEAVQRYGGVPPYSETRQYVSSIVKDFNRKKTASQPKPAAAPEKTSKKSKPAQRQQTSE